MNITRDNLKIFKPELIGNSDDAGGQRTKNPVVSGKLNEVFRAISDVDHSQSAVDIVKVYPSLDTNDTSILLDAHVFISQRPTDPLVNMLVAESVSLTDADRMPEMVDIIESGVRAGQLIRDGLVGMLKGQDSFPASYLQSKYSFNGNEYYSNVTLTQGQVIVISVEYEGNENALWPRFEHYCQVLKTISGTSVGGYNVQFSPPLPYGTPDGNITINSESGCTHLRYTSETDDVIYHGVTKLTEATATNEIKVTSTTGELLPSVETVSRSSGNTINSGDNDDLPSSVVVKSISQPTVKDQSTYLFTVTDMLDDPFLVQLGLQIKSFGYYSHLTTVSVTGNTASVVYGSSNVLGSDGLIGVTYVSGLRYSVYNNSNAFNAANKIAKGTVKAVATFVDGNYGTAILSEQSDGSLMDSSGYNLASINYITGVYSKAIDARGDFTIAYTCLVEAAAISDNTVTFFLEQDEPIFDSFYMTISTAVDTLLSASGDGSGVITGTDITGTIVGKEVSLNFNQTVDLSTLRYDISEISRLLPPAALYGLDPLRIKNGGVVDIFTQWKNISIQHTQVQVVNSPTPDATLTVRSNARFVDITDSTGASLWTITDTNYSVVKDTGIVTLHSDFTGFIAPFVLTDTIGELALVVDKTDTTLILANDLSQSYPLNSDVASVYNLGDLQARVGSVRDMTSWSDNWDQDGTATTASLNVVDYPIEVLNDTAVNESWVLIFTSTTAFRCVGKRIGQIALGDTVTDFAPINPLTLAPYFIIRNESFGAGWSAGEAIRFETVATGKPTMLLRTVKAGHSQITTDRATIALRGNES
ncbi:hypothetical protein S144_39 [Shewanella sp. phage 1/44]|uniref:hypothetical protein n=1 Tax=Shewanella sp. phage 1/44 TaxID=1458862 RepID=UPI0004F661B3|nr:hypothetical protein S144_39 [Shewanella sp. phage 1/44]AHK11753.1 hypothetical protein S144_39 [Shewanella sp. phage 1/44]